MRFLKLLLLSLAPLLAHGAISYYNAANLGSSGLASYTTASFDSGTGSNRIVFVSIAHATATHIVTAISYGGTAMTEIAFAPKSGQGAVALWYLATSVPSGSNTFTVTSAAGGTFYVGASAYAGASSTLDVNKSDVTTTAASGGTGAYTQTLTTTVANDWMIAVAYGGGATWNSNSSSNTRVLASNMHLYDNGPYASAGSSSLTATTSFSGGAAVMSVTVAFSPAGSGGGSSVARRRVTSDGQQ